MNLNNLLSKPEASAGNFPKPECNFEFHVAGGFVASGEPFRTTSSQRLRRPSANVRAPNVGSVDFESGYGMEGNGAGLTGQNPQVTVSH